MIKIILFIIAITSISSFITGCSSSTPENNKKPTKQEIQQEKEQSAAIQLVEEVKTNYASGNYIAANDKLNKLSKNKFGSKYTDMLNQDYPDLAQKSNEQKEQEAAKRQQNLNNFNSAMSDIDIYEGVSLSDGMLTVNVNSQWYLLNYSQKEYFVETCKIAADNYSLPYAFMVVRYPAGKKTVARYNESNGISIEK